jgi:hypothetical protein
MISNNAPAEFGNFQGGIGSGSIKSGTNQFHGGGFEFIPCLVRYLRAGRSSILSGIRGRSWPMSTTDTTSRPRSRERRIAR